MEFGPEIKVDGKRPEWLKDDEVCDVFDQAWCSGSKTLTASYWYWNTVTAFRLPVDHPHYQQNTPTPDERAVALVKRICGLRSRYNADINPIFEEARAIVAALEPVDPTLLEARRVVAGLYEGQGVAHLREQALSGEGDEWFHTKVAKAALARGRQLEKEGK